VPFAFAWGRDEGKVLDDGISPLHHGLAEVFLCGCSKKYQFRTQLPSPTFKQRTIHSKILQLPEFFLPVPFVCYMLQLCHFKEVKKQDALKKNASWWLSKRHSPKEEWRGKYDTILHSDH
jgi:hypothetical protein